MSLNGEVAVVTGGSRGIGRSVVEGLAREGAKVILTGRKTKEGLTEAIPMGRFGNPEDVAEAVLFLVSSRAGYLTGQVLQVNGGMYM